MWTDLFIQVCISSLCYCNFIFVMFKGHSNGGQGAWWLSSHYPDKALAGFLCTYFDSILTLTKITKKSDSCIGISQNTILYSILHARRRRLC